MGEWSCPHERETLYIKNYVCVKLYHNASKIERGKNKYKSAGNIIEVSTSNSGPHNITDEEAFL